MHERYSLPEFVSIWSEESKYERWLLVELSLLKALKEVGIAEDLDVLEVYRKLPIDIDINEIARIEIETKHDVIAFVTYLEKHTGCRWIHYGITSSDVVDTALNLALRESLKIIKKYWEGYLDELEKLSRTDTMTIGRSHGQYGEPINFGYVIKGHLEEAKRNALRLEDLITQISYGQYSGAMGNYAHIPPKVEEIACMLLDLKPEPHSTQVIPRDRHAMVFSTLAVMAAGLERLALNIRHLSRSEVGEVQEGFSKGQKGSSAMPHKKNPISCENICGLSRMMRSYVLPSIENISLWHERDISHSSVERHIAPDATNLLAYMTKRMTQVLQNLVINKEKMSERVEANEKNYRSEHDMLALVRSGESRKKAYEIIQRRYL
jgi:adenylosuccinate lyase